MSDSEGDQETCYYGTPLDPYDEDAFPKKRPISVEEQVAKDAQGRRRFHGAFTGGFSAGFYNTVGSLEGWRPSEFRSSRGEKAENKKQKPEDFMDDEDTGEFGIAPQTVRATSDFNTSKKRKKKVFADGPIPGVPVLETLLQAGNETVGYFLMKNMNQKHNVEKGSSNVKIYGCVMPKDLPSEESFTDVEYKLHDIYKQYLAKPKSNTAGLGYVGLNKEHDSLFKASNLVVKERNNKKLSISGQAFGVGAFEDDDEDIYVREDMSKYDFELGAEMKKINHNWLRKKETLALGLFVKSTSNFVSNDNFPLPVIPNSFSGKHNLKKSRFEPLPEENITVERKNINASVRAKYLGEEPSNTAITTRPEAKPAENIISNVKPLKDKKAQPSFLSSLNLDRFVSAEQDDDVTNLLENVKPSESEHGTKEMRDAVKLKMFGPLTRITLTWQPNSLLCKRFNVPEPKNDDSSSMKNKKRTKNLIFEYQKHQEENANLTPGLLVTKTEQPSTSLQETEITPVEEPAVVETSTASQSMDTSEDQTQTEAVIDITDRLDISKNVDLFKAIFLSSSESESENEEEATKRKEQIAANTVLEPLVPKIKPMKEGILSNIDFTKFQQPIIKKEPINIPDDTYGPMLPSNFSKNVEIVKNEIISDDEWVEKGSVDVVDRKHKKKHKKEKSKHKKSKNKSKR